MRFVIELSADSGEQACDGTVRYIISRHCYY